MQEIQETWIWSLGGGNGNPLQYSCLENSVDRLAVYGVTKSQTWLSAHTIKGNTRDLSQALSSQQQNWGNLKLKVHEYSWGGLSRGEFSIVLGQRSTESSFSWSQKDQHHLPILHLCRGLSSCRTQRYVAKYVPWGTRTFPMAPPLFRECFSWVFSFPPLRSLITETCSRASTVARLT